MEDTRKRDSAVLRTPKVQNQELNEVYEIGWICALHTELAVARAMLDEDRGMAQFSEVGDPNTYAIGRIHQHNVVIACLPAGIDGTTAAATAAQNMMRSFPQIRVGLLVGIGGGIPNLTKGIDIRLGDIVVSQPDGEYGGVVQYAKGKWQNDSDGSGFKFVRKGSLNKPPIFILKALQMLQAEHETDDSQIPVFLQEMLDRKPKMKKTGYTYPGADRDRLFHSPSAKNDQNDNSSTSDCKEVVRDSRDSLEPVIHYGNIVSGDLVIKHAGIRDALRDEFGAVCVEMEAAGLMDTFPCLVIRGICDYADSFKNDAWHPYAAAVAAAYAKEFLLYISPQQVHQSHPAREVIDQRTHELLGLSIVLQERTLDHQRQTAETAQSSYDKERALKCHQSFACIYEEYKDVNPDRAPGTCNWVLDHPRFKGWKRSSHTDLLWISADPGCGKSVLTKSLIDNELRETHSTICYFFFKDNTQQDSLKIALKALLYQLFSQKPELICHAMTTWEKKGGSAPYEVNEMWRILMDAVADPKAGSVFCLLDALDECCEKDRRMLITLVSENYQRFSSRDLKENLKFLVTSRPYANVERWFDQVMSDMPQIRLRGEDENDRIHEEINLVISRQVEELTARFLLSKTNQEWLFQKLVQMKHRTYLWLHLAMDEIYKTYQNSLHPDDVRIESIPASVNDAYERILKAIDPKAKSNAQKVLMIIIGAQRPLTIGEMALALVASNTYESGTPAARSPNVILLEGQIRQWCGLFVFINHSKLFLLHQTAKEFLLGDELSSVHEPLEWRSSLIMSEIERAMTRLCVQYLHAEAQKKSRSVNDMPVDSDSSNQAAKLQDTTNDDKVNFFDYCAQKWSVHLDDQFVVKDEDLLSRILFLCDTNSQLFSSWFPIMWNSLGSPMNRKRPKLLDQHVVALTGHPSILSVICSRQGFDVNGRDSEGNTALGWASKLGHETVVRLLLDAGADVNVQGEIFGAPLHAASEHGHEKVVQILLASKANPNLRRHSSPQRQDWNGRTPLSVAAVMGRTAIVRLLLRHENINVNARDQRGMTPLFLAASAGKHETVKTLLAHGEIDVNVGDKSGFTPVMRAAQLGDAETVQVFLRTPNININLREDTGQTALSTATESGEEKVVQLLLGCSNIDTNTRDETGQTPISLAVLGGSKKLAKILLEDTRVDVNCRDRDGCTPLLQSSERGQTHMVNVLLEHSKIEIGLEDQKGRTPFSEASKEGHAAVVKQLLEYVSCHQSDQTPDDLQITHATTTTSETEPDNSKYMPNDVEIDALIRKLLTVRKTKPGRRNLVQLKSGEVRYLCAKASEIFLEQPTLLEVKGPLKVCGDIRGSYDALLDIFELCGNPAGTDYLFLGNYVSKGPQSLETICLLLAFKIKYKERFYLLRGKQEGALGRIYGFYDECKKRYNTKLWKLFLECFNCMPIAAIIDEKIFAVHTGLSPDLDSMDQIRSIVRPIDIPDTGLMCDLLWSDPDRDIVGWAESDRGVSLMFGADIVSQFLEKHDLNLICRSSQIVNDGYEFLPNRQLVTLFSLPDYAKSFQNYGSVMSLDKNTQCTFQILHPETGN